MRIGRRFRDCGFYGEKVESTKDQAHQAQGFKNIKPESDITFEEAEDFWDNMFSHEINELPDEIVDPDGADDLPDEITL